MTRISLEKLASFQKELGRERFMPGRESLARIDAAFPIGYEQTISQPSLVLYMTNMLELNSEVKVLEIGTGSGYQTALLAKFAKEVYTVERIRPLHESAMYRLLEMGYDNIFFKYGDGTKGWLEHAPYDRIMVTAAASEIPQNLVNQLKPGGIMVVPAGGYMQHIYLVYKDKDGNVQVVRDISVRFVPLVED